VTISKSGSPSVRFQTHYPSILANRSDKSSYSLQRVTAAPAAAHLKSFKHSAVSARVHWVFRPGDPAGVVSPKNKALVKHSYRIVVAKGGS
jgi:hypothetical protein